MMLLRQMRYFITVVECNSFTKAAEQCSVSQSAISQQIQVLEKELGAELIHRENRRFTLTPAGEYFYRKCMPLINGFDNLQSEIKCIGQSDETQFRIGYLKCYGGQELHQAIEEFSVAHSGISVQVISGTHEELHDLLRTDLLDFALTDQRRAFSDEYMNFELLLCDCCVEISSRNRLASLKRVEMEDLAQMPCVLISSREQQAIEQDYYNNTLGFANNFLFADSLKEGRTIVADNRGFMPIESVGTLPPPEADVCRIPLSRYERQLQRNYCAFWKKNQTRDYILEFAEMLRGLLRSE